jgi:hypothetical protein
MNYVHFDMWMLCMDVNVMNYVVYGCAELYYVWICGELYCVWICDDVVYVFEHGSKFLAMQLVNPISVFFYILVDNLARCCEIL